MILDALDELMVGRTTFVIAHRLSTVRHADLIVVVNNGRVVEQGSHSELLLAGGLYAQLWDAQIGRRRSRRRLSEADPDHGPEDDLSAEIARIAAENGASHSGAARLIVAAVTPLIERADDSSLRSLAARHDDSAPAVALAAELADRLLDDLVLKQAAQ